jgi:hypothetical protein
MPRMDLGVLKDMPGIRDRARAKLVQKEVATLSAGSQPIHIAAWFKLLVSLNLMPFFLFRSNVVRRFYQPTRRW